MSLGQLILEYIGRFVIEYSFGLVITVFLGVAIWDYYNKCLRINRNTDNIDLMAMYLDIQMRKKYGRKKV